MFERLFVAGGLVLGLVGPGSALDLDPAVATVFGSMSLPAPDPAHLIVCHGFGCAYRTPVVLREADRSQLRHLLAPGRASPAAERRSVAAAVAWFDRRVAPVAGTAHAKARAGFGHAGDPSQFDCFDRTSNTTEVLVLLKALGLLRHHTVDVPVSRGFLVGAAPHTTAVMREQATGRKWAIDAWTHNNGERPDVMPVEVWFAQN